MIELYKNSFGMLQQVGHGYRIVRNGDGLVSHRVGSYEKIKLIFDALGAVKITYCTKACVDGMSKRMNDWQGEFQGSVLAWSELPK